MYIQRFEHDNIYFWSDLHYGHDRDFIYKPRGHSDCQVHDNHVQKQLEKLPEDSTLFLLGDTIFGPNSEVRLEELLNIISSKQVFVMPGNHFNGYKGLKKQWGRNITINVLNNGGKEIHFIDNLYEIEVGGQFIVLSHYPILSWNKVGKGSWMVHGHTHGRIPQTLPNGNGMGKILDVSVESVNKPLSFTDIQLIMSKKTLYAPDHHAN